MPTRPNEAELEEFLTRAVAEVIVKDDLAALLRSGERRLRIKQGFDPTRPNLHLGHAISLRKLRTLARWGHEIVIIIGDYTTQIGDPTDKSESRPMISHEQVLENARTYLEQFHRIVPRENTRVVYQQEWYGTFGLKDVFDLASRFTVQQMLAREEFRKRQAAGTAIPIKDLLYPLLQAYDSVAIEAQVEFGGTDQKFNILAGRELQGMIGQPPQQVFLVQMLEGTDGLVMSKTKPHTAVWLLDPPEQAFGKVMSIPDDLMPHYFEWGTEMPLAEVRAALDALARKELHPREAKEKVARRIVTELHSAAAADEAARAFARQFREGQAPEEVPVVSVPRDGETTVPIVDLLVRAQLQPSKGQARRLVQQRGVRVNDVLADEATTVATDDEALVRYGPRSFARIRWV
jgi:tyrosyl-tRNA synthetase